MKIIFIGYNSGRFFKKVPDIDNSFYTYGFNSRRAKALKEYYPDYKIEVWRLAYETRKYYEKEINGIIYKIYPAIKLGKIIHISFRALFHLRSALLEPKTVIHFSNLHSYFTYLISALFRKYPMIVQDHGEVPLQLKANSHSGLHRMYFILQLLIEKKVFKYLDYFYLGDVNQIPYLQEVKPDFKGEISPSIGIDMSSFPVIQRNSAKTELGWNLDNKYILYVGRLDEVKHVDALIRIWQEIRKSQCNVELVFVGGMESDKFYSLALLSGVKMYKRIMNTEIYKFYCAADVYVLLGLDNIKFGGIGIAVTESLACGTPVVSSNMRNFLERELTGIGEAPVSLEDHKAAIMKILEKPENYHNCRDAIIRCYSNNAVARRLNNTILSLVQ
jgi:glycosyltransferase involved in cell wall biosynthesis